MEKSVHAKSWTSSETEKQLTHTFNTYINLSEAGGSRKCAKDLKTFQASEMIQLKSIYTTTTVNFSLGLSDFMKNFQNTVFP